MEDMSSIRKLKKRGNRLERWSVATGLSILYSRPSRPIAVSAAALTSMGDSVIVRGHHFIRSWRKRDGMLVAGDWVHHGYVG
jgi:hypothetical protein